jgi:NADP-dependent 3-hydroxy acid dehydrogenase YdfG
MLLGPGPNAPSDEWERMAALDAAIEVRRTDDIADAVSYIVTRDRRVAINELLVHPAEQGW